MKRLFLLLLPAMFILQACEDSAPVTVPELLSFSFEKAKNYALPEDIIFEDLESSMVVFRSPKQPKTTRNNHL